MEHNEPPAAEPAPEPRRADPYRRESPVSSPALDPGGDVGDGDVGDGDVEDAGVGARTDDEPPAAAPRADGVDEVHPEHGFATGEEPVDGPTTAAFARPQHAPDFDQPVYSEQQLAPVAQTNAEAGARPVPRVPQIEQRLSMPIRVVGGVVAGLLAGQGVARFGEMVLQAVGVVAGSVPPLIGVLGFVLFALPIAACALLASRGTRYALIVGGVLALVVAVLGRIGGVDLLAVLSG